MRQPRPLRIGQEPSRLRLIMIPVISVMLASVITTLPIMAKSPILPPLGLIVLLAWRLLRADMWPVWIAAPLGLWDDLFSGQPLGSAMLLWTIIMLVVEYIDTQMWWRDYWQDWGIAALAIAFALVGGVGLLAFVGVSTDARLVVPQIIWSALFYPMMSRLIAHIDLWRLKR